MNLALKYVLFMVIYMLIDMVWIFGARPMHIRMVEDVQKEPLKVNMTAGLLFYLLSPLAYVVIIEPHSTNLKEAIKLSITTASLMYGTFDLTNKTLFRHYSWSYTFADIWWGIIALTLTTLIMFQIQRKTR